ncbi:hypothetical protein LTR29_010285 [Friedmanniomyces endolithicus]|nr:hypothetical protein LTR29_010285 [Friedmanniomyces endolithicus]
MAPATYLPVEADDEHSSAREQTPPETTYSDDNDDDEGLEDLEAKDGYELRDLNADARPRQQGVVGGSADKEAGDDDDEDDEDHEDGGDVNGHARRRRASVQSYELYTPDEERRIAAVRHHLHHSTPVEIDPDRRYTDIGNARLAGLTDDLHLSDDQYQWLLTAFYISYILFEWMTICYQLFPPHIYISCCVFAWGVLAALQAVTTNFAGILVLRALLGIGEAAFVGIPFYLSFFFRQDELAFRIGLFISAAPLATSFASSLAWLIVRFGDQTGIASWRLLLLVEGFPACLIAAWAWRWIPDAPQTARWLTSRERRVATLRMRKEADGDGGALSGSQSTTPRHKRKFNWREALRTLRDPKAYLTAGMFFCCNVAFSSMPVFLPTIVHSMGYSTLASQGLSAPPFLFAFLAVLTTAFLSDRLRSRSGPMIFHACLATAGYILLAVAGTLHLGHLVRYLAVFPICAGFFSAVTIVITWTVNNQPSDEGKGTGMAMLNVIGQMGPLLGTRLYPDAEGPYYVKGMSVCAVAMAMVGILAFTLRMVLKAENARRKSGWREAEEEEGEALVGSRSKSEPFIYLI